MSHGYTPITLSSRLRRKILQEEYESDPNSSFYLATPKSIEWKMGLNGKCRILVSWDDNLTSTVFMLYRDFLHLNAFAPTLDIGTIWTQQL